MPMPECRPVPYPATACGPQRVREFPDRKTHGIHDCLRRRIHDYSAGVFPGHIYRSCPDCVSDSKWVSLILKTKGGLCPSDLLTINACTRHGNKRNNGREMVSDGVALHAGRGSVLCGVSCRNAAAVRSG
jgi:hypothetical protein